MTRLGECSRPGHGAEACTLYSLCHSFKEGFHDPLRALEVLERQGRLTRIVDQVAGRNGLVPSEA